MNKHYSNTEPDKPLSSIHVQCSCHENVPWIILGMVIQTIIGMMGVLTLVRFFW